jgi:glycerophosphoryl diester phosphodiesterase
MTGFLLALGLLLPVEAAAPSAPAVLIRAYAHNDYNHDRPLFEALDHGFFGVEADVHLRGDELFVAHTGGGIKPGRTLRTLYLDPLLKLVRRNHGRVYPNGPKGFLLMIEFKSGADESYVTLEQMLQPYREMLTVYFEDHIKEGAVTISITGHRPNDLLKAEPLRYAGIDGDFHDLNETHKTLFPTMSDDFNSYFSWHGSMSRSDRDRLRKYVALAHKYDRKIRLWGIPANEALWEELYAAGVDLINTDDLDKLRDFLSKKVAVRWLSPDSLARFWDRLKTLPKDPFR